MCSDSYPFKVGTFECFCINDGTFVYEHPLQILFANAPAASLDQAVRNYGLDPQTWTEFLSPYTCLLIRTGEHNVLVDTGAGALGPSTGQLLDNLRTIGVMPDMIDTVILTHAHADHVGGNLDANGNLVFAGARWVMWKGEWEFWMDQSPDLSRTALPNEMKDFLVAVARRNLAPLQNNIELIDYEMDIVPGVRIFPAPGHTPGHLAVSVISERERLLHLVDSIVHPIQLGHPEWFAAFDTLPEVTVATRRQILEQIVTDHDLVLCFHFPPFPSLGHIVKQGTTWQWQPVDSATSL